jgi:U3 small nucleolar RNA-associated protein 5
MSGQVFVAYGLLVKPSFQKILVHSGAVVKLRISNDGVLLPMSQSRVKSEKGLDLQNGGMISPCKLLSSLIKFSLNVLWD